MTEAATFAELRAPLGEPGSARRRYAAAMALYQAGEIGADVLEVYRSCASLDAQDPQVLLDHCGLPSPVLRNLGAAKSIAILLAEISRYLARLSGPGLTEVTQGYAQVVSAKITPQATRPNPVVGQYLSAALVAAVNDEPALVGAIRSCAAYLQWATYDGYDPGEIGADFMQGHAYTSIIGQDAPIAAPDFDLGLFLIAPHVLYRDHCHPAPELYAPLTGPHGWRFGPNAPLILKPAHDPIWNEPYAPHLTKVGAVPFLCIFAWTRDTASVARVIPADDWEALEKLRLGGNHA